MMILAEVAQSPLQLIPVNIQWVEFLILENPQDTLCHIAEEMHLSIKTCTLQKLDWELILYSQYSPGICSLIVPHEKSRFDMNGLHIIDILQYGTYKDDVKESAALKKKHTGF